MDSLRKAIRPTEVDVLWGRADESLDMNAYADAAYFLDTLATKTPKDGQVFALRGQVRRCLGDFRGALMDFDEALRLDTADLQAALEKGHFLVEMGFLDDALACCELVTGRATKKDAKLAAVALFLIGKISLLRGEQEAALGTFSRAIALEPEDPDMRSARGFLYFMLGREKEADKDFIEATRLRREAASEGTDE
jgi:Flp pilus assembly protein TadD